MIQQLLLSLPSVKPPRNASVVLHEMSVCVWSLYACTQLRKQHKPYANKRNRAKLRLRMLESELRAATAKL